VSRSNRFSRIIPGPPQPVVLPAPAALSLTHRAASDLINSPGEQAQQVELVDHQPGMGQQVADGLGHRA